MTSMQRRLALAKDSATDTEWVGAGAGSVHPIQHVIYASTQCVTAYAAWEGDRGSEALRTWWNAAEAYYEAAKAAVEQAKTLPASKSDILYTLQDARDEAFEEMAAIIDRLQEACAAVTDAAARAEEDERDDISEDPTILL